MLNHRAAEDDDLPALCRLVQSAQELYYFYPRARFPLTPEQARQIVRQSHDPTVVTMDGRLAGFANFTRIAPNSRCTLGNVIVEASLRGRGVGRYLLDVMMSKARERYQAPEIETDCPSDNVAGLLLYTKLGFSPTAIEVCFAPDCSRHALIHMVRRQGSSNPGARQTLPAEDKAAITPCR
jgi:ribosomal protein S18 acetylase RimI-like enzyme